MTNINSLFDSIKDSMEKSTGQSNRGQFLRTEVGNTYTVRLIPNVTDPAKTFFHYYTHGWTSFATGQYINQISPDTWGERDPILKLGIGCLRLVLKKKSLRQQQLCVVKTGWSMCW